MASTDNSKTRKWEVEPEIVEEIPENILITSALPYVNNTPHLGNVIGCVLSADVYARFCRLRGHNTLYICGTDEYGTATENKARIEGLTPREICDKYFKIHKQVYDWFNIQFDRFGRTSTKEQEETCHEIFDKVLKNEMVFTDAVQQLLCVKCDRFLADRFVEGICPFCAYEDARGDQCDKCGKLINAIELKNPRCISCKESPIVKQSTHFFIDLPKIEPELKRWMEINSKNWSANAKQIAEGWIKDGLKPRCITRDLKWGVPVPVDGYQSKVFYVWFDAPIGYISITKQLTPNWRDWWLPEGKNVTLVQFMAKDNVPFHAVMFPSCLLATGTPYTKPSKIYATEYLNYEGDKFSKSRGVGVFGTDLFETEIPSDIWRFYLLYIRPESQDSSFSWADLALKNNSELLNNFGNFVNRVLKFLFSNFQGKVPDVDLNDADESIIHSVQEELTTYISNISTGKLREGLRNILSISRIGNQYIQNEKPWVLIKSEETKARAGAVFGLACNIVALLSILLEPYMPESSARLQQQLNMGAINKKISDKFSQILKPGHEIKEPSPLFKKIEESHVQKLRAKFSGSA